MVTVLILLCGGILEGTTPKTKSFVLPQAGYIATFEIDDPNLKFYTLDGKDPRSFSTAPGVPIQVCEGLDYIFVTTETKNQEMNLLIYDRGLRRKWTIRNSSLYYANVIDGKLFGLNLASNLSHPVPFPFLATEFDVRTKAFTTHSLFKLPDELHRHNTTPPQYWIFRLGKVFIAFTRISSSAYLLDENYLESEKFSIPGVATKILKIPLDIPGGFKNPGEMKVDRVMTAEEFRPLRLKWLDAKTYIYSVWQQGKDIIFCYGAQETGKTHVAKLDSMCSTIYLGTFEGYVRTGKDNEVWIMNVTPQGWSVSRRHLP